MPGNDEEFNYIENNIPQDILEAETGEGDYTPEQDYAFAESAGVYEVDNTYTGTQGGKGSDNFTPPHDLNAEQAVIGGMYMNHDMISVANEFITGADFYDRTLGIYFDTMGEMEDKGQAIDEITLQNALRAKKVPQEYANTEYIRNLVLNVPESSHVGDYAKAIKEKSTRRRLIKASREIMSSCYEEENALEDVLSDAEKEIFDVTQHQGGEEFTPIHEVVKNTFAKIQRAAKADGNITGIPTGFKDLDTQTAGFQPSDLILIAARPSMGKTAFALNVAEFMAFRHDEAVAIFSLEMPKEQLVQRLISMESKVDAQHLRTGDLSKAEWERAAETGIMIGDSKLFIDDTAGITVAELRSKCRKLKMDHDLKIVFIDYLQLMTGSGKRSSDSRQQEVSDISRALKSLARELNVPIVALSQLSRAVESRPDHRPMMSDLRESGAIEQDADMVMFIYRDDYYNKDTERKGISEIIIAKQRNGPIGTIELLWMPQFTKFANLEHHYDNQNQ